MSMTTMTARLPMPAGQDPGAWRVLTEVIFPLARSTQSIELALEYCRARNLDVMKRPINIVPVWSAELGREIETIWQGIGETQITAARSKEWAGLDPARYGIPVTNTFKGRRKAKGGGWENTEVTLTYPEWCEVTVYRMIAGARQPFTERIYWLEAYGRMGGALLPNAMWSKRPYGQVQKVAKAASLRAAFPEESAGPTDEEMAGGSIDEAQAPDPVHHSRPAIQTPEEYSAALNRDADHSRGVPADTEAGSSTEKGHDPETGEVRETPPSVNAVTLGDEETWQQWGHRFIARLRAQKTLEGFDAVMTDANNVKVLEEMAKEVRTDQLLNAAQAAKLPLIKLNTVS
jgi:phage recombination protein Bet